MPMVCAAGPLHLAEGQSYKYGGEITDQNGSTHKLDPHLEVVKSK
jgi:hypothetical protein